MKTKFRIFAVFIVLLSMFCTPAAWAQDDDDDDGGSAWWLWAIIFGGAASMEFNLLGPQQFAVDDPSCRALFVRGRLISADRSADPSSGSTAIMNTSSSIVFEESVGLDQALRWSHETSTESLAVLRVTVWRLNEQGRKLPLTPGCQPQMSAHSASTDDGSIPVVSHPIRIHD